MKWWTWAWWTCTWWRWTWWEPSKIQFHVNLIKVVISRTCLEPLVLLRFGAMLLYINMLQGYTMTCICTHKFLQGSSRIRVQDNFTKLTGSYSYGRHFPTGNKSFVGILGMDIWLLINHSMYMSDTLISTRKY